MLYLIKSSKYLKIGYTDNLIDRLKQYDTHNPDYELISTLDLPKRHEKKLQKLCMPWHYKTEWFYDSEEVRKIFDNYEVDVIKELIDFTKIRFDTIFKIFANNFNNLFEMDRIDLYKIYNIIVVSKENDCIEELKSKLTDANNYYEEFITNYKYWINQQNILKLLWNNIYTDANGNDINWNLNILPGYECSINTSKSNHDININVHLIKYHSKITYNIKE